MSISRKSIPHITNLHLILQVLWTLLQKFAMCYQIQGKQARLCCSKLVSPFLTLIQVQLLTF